MFAKRIPPLAAVLVTAAFFLLALNQPFLHQLYATVAPNSLFTWAFLAAIVLSAFSMLTLFFTLLSGRYVFKPAVTLFLLLTSAAAYFMSEYGIVFDMGMMRNITHTNTGEAFDLVTGKLVLYVLALGMVPSIIVWLLPIAHRPLRQELWSMAKAAGVLLPLSIIVLLPFTGSAMSLFREHRVILHAFLPLNYVSAATAYTVRLRSAHAHPAPRGLDAHKGSSSATARSRTLTVLVIGETARAQNFSLNGYARETNPLLAQVPELITFTNVHSCGTATAQSVPCMFSGDGRAKFQRVEGQEGLLHILQRAGFSVLWRENQGGCVGVCQGIPTEVLPNAGRRSFFDVGEAIDEALITNLDARIDAMQGDSVIVLHMMGSHGPAYYKRYPPKFERFKPACRDAQFSRCSQSEIVNSYDNTILYTDYVLAKLIALLRARDAQGMSTAMIYLSDHGESLGESNLYLHGLPYAFAPDVQKHVPMLVWLSPKAQDATRIDTSCLATARHQPLTHDNFFHSVLGLLDVRTSLYDPRLDIFARCHTATPVLFRP